MTTRQHRWRRRDAGASAVEMAIVLPLLAFLVFGIIDLGRVLNAEIELSQGVREGVRMAALSGNSTTYTKPAIRARVIAAAPNPAFGPNPTVSDADITLCAASPLASDVATVTARVTFRGILWTPPGGVLQQTAVMRCGA